MSPTSNRELHVSALKASHQKQHKNEDYIYISYKISTWKYEALVTKCINIYMLECLIYLFLANLEKKLTI